MFIQGWEVFPHKIMCAAYTDADTDRMAVENYFNSLRLIFWMSASTPAAVTSLPAPGP